jgi:hypothetical protein
LQPHHDFLDVGCGWLRLGAALLPYLEEGRYYGLDNTQMNLDIGREFLKRLGIRQAPHLLCSPDFAFQEFGKMFDVAFSHAVFTHLSHAQIEQCLMNLTRVMKAGSLGFVTLYLSSKDSERANDYQLAGGRTLHYASSQVSPGFLGNLARRLGLKCEILREQAHPTGQQVIRVQFPGAPMVGTTILPTSSQSKPERAAENDGRTGAEIPAPPVSAPPSQTYHQVLAAAGLNREWPIDRLRDDLGHKGYAVIREFCSPGEAEEIKRFWHHHPMSHGDKGYWIGRADYAMHGAPRRSASGRDVWPHDLRYECFFWNQPAHRLTYEVAWAANAIRNAVTGMPVHCFLLPLYGYAACYRPTRSDVGTPGVGFHVDQRDPNQPRPVQNSILLSDPGQDYRGGGLVLTVRDGRRIEVFSSEDMHAGDLLIWDQRLGHEVPPVTASDPDSPCAGFWRILMPINPVVARSDQWKKGMVDNPEKPAQPLAALR